MAQSETPEANHLNPNWVEGQPVTYRDLLARDARAVVSVTEAAALLGVSTSTVRAYTKRKLLFAPDTGGGRVLITKASLVAFLTAEPPPPAADRKPAEPAWLSSEPQKRSGAFNLEALRPTLRRRSTSGKGGD